MSKYGRKLTKEELQNAGITEITEEGRVFRGEVELIPFPNGKQNYLVINIYDRDNNGNLIKIKRQKTSGYTYKTRTLGLHRVIWAWMYGEVPEGMIVDHKNNKHSTLEDYTLDNLQLLTPAENLNKEHPDWHTTELKCKMTNPRSYYEDKLEKYLTAYNNETDKDKKHYLGTNISKTRARLRYWDSHKEEYDQYIAEKAEQDYKRQEKKASVRDRKILAQYKQVFKEAGNKAMWHEVCKVEKMWDSLQSIQKEHIFKVLHNFFSKHGMTL